MCLSIYGLYFSSRQYWVWFLLVDLCVIRVKIHILFYRHSVKYKLSRRKIYSPLLEILFTPGQFQYSWRWAVRSLLYWAKCGDNVEFMELFILLVYFTAIDNQCVVHHRILWNDFCISQLGIDLVIPVCFTVLNDTPDGSFVADRYVVVDKETCFGAISNFVCWMASSCRAVIQGTHVCQNI